MWHGESVGIGAVCERMDVWISVYRNVLHAKRVFSWVKGPATVWGRGVTMSVFLTLPHSFPCFADLTMVWGKIELLQKILDLKYHVHFSDVVREDKFDPRCRPGMWDGSIRALHAD